MNTQTKFEKHEATATIAKGEQSSKDFEDFVYLLSHDVRASVRALLELPKWIKQDLIEEGHVFGGSLATHMALMDSHTKRLDRMLNDLLAYSRVGRNQEAKQVDIEEVADMVVDQVVPLKRFNVEVEIEPAALQIGEADIFTLFSALLTNSVKHHHESNGTIQIKSWLEDDICIIRVSDDGPGIPQKYVECVFEAMRTLKPRDEVEGSGMGLTIVRKIVETYGGQLSCLPSDGTEGTTIEVRFPTAAAHA